VVVEPDGQEQCASTGQLRGAVVQAVADLAGVEGRAERVVQADDQRGQVDRPRADLGELLGDHPRRGRATDRVVGERHTVGTAQGVGEQRGPAPPPLARTRSGTG
jgi:hypothetical protein